MEPLLIQAVLQGIVVLVLPLRLAKEQPVGHPAEGGHDDGVHEEACSCLSDAHYAISQEDETMVDQPVVRVPRGPLHDVQLCILVGKRDGWQHINPQVSRMMATVERDPIQVRNGRIPRMLLVKDFFKLLK